MALTDWIQIAWGLAMPLGVTFSVMLAQRLGRNAAGWMWLSFFFWPVVFVLAYMPPKERPRQLQ